MAEDQSVLVDVHGRPLFSRASVTNDGVGFVPYQPRPHRAADPFSNELGGWLPGLGSADADWLPDRDLTIARARDLYRNDPLFAGQHQVKRDNIIGQGLRLTATPDAELLGIPADEAKDIGKQLEGLWAEYAEDLSFTIDVTRQTNFRGLITQAFFMWDLMGEICVLPMWLERGGSTGTCFMMIDPDRLSNPQDKPDEEHLRKGVALGQYGDAVGYHLRNAHPGDLYGHSTAEKYRWTYVPRENAWGRPTFLHGFMPERGAHRGKPPMAALLETAKLREIKNRLEMMAYLAQARFAAVWKTPFPEQAFAHLGATGVGHGSQSAASGFMGSYQSLSDWSADFHRQRALAIEGAKVIVSPPGADLEFKSVNRPNNNFAAFEDALMTAYAAASGVSREQLTRDYSRSNYTAGRMSGMESWKHFRGEASWIEVYAANQKYSLACEEWFETNRVDLPSGVPGFWDARYAWTKARWNGPGRGQIDPVKETQAAAIRVASGISTLERECAEQGLNWLDVLDQIEREQKAFSERGLPYLNLDQIMAANASTDSASMDAPSSNESGGRQ